MSERKPYPSDLSDARWALIEPTLTAWRKARLDRRPTGQPAKVDLRDVFNAILYVNRTGIPWKYLPHDFPNHGTVYAYYAAWRDEGRLPPAGELGPGSAEPSPMLQCCEVQPAVVPDHQLGVDYRLDTGRGRGPDDLREGRAKVGAPPGLEVRLGAGENEDTEPVDLLLEQHGPCSGRQCCHGAGQHRLDGR